MRNNQVKRISVSERIFLNYMAFFAIISLVTVPINLLYQLPFHLNYKWIAIALLCAIAGSLAYRGVHTKRVHLVTVTAMTFVVIPGAWFSSAGLQSPSVIYSVAVMLLINFTLTGWLRWFFNGALTVVTALLIAATFIIPNSFTRLSVEQQFFDWVTHVSIMLTFMALQLITFAKAYEKAQHRNQQQTEKLAQLAHTDPLTGVNNRLNLMSDIMQAKNSGEAFALIIMDVDHFKAFNDSYGHLEGDQCLKTVASILMSAVKRSGDRVYRFGGEEFIALLTRTQSTDAEEFAEHVRLQIEQAAIPHSKSSVADVVTASFGVASCTPASKHSPEALIELADKALYAAKAKGRNRIHRAG
ncbi:GGDEF domain-containing protein [Salinibius halmophilus]|uniref:GGDEF domain-containing protein n=1 Tax=Salinibius halmophilus TaxID=1853216 RepID=UPI001314483C|nr:GGDEF domain-containing protein [Salinibius halmophilus]